MQVLSGFTFSNPLYVYDLAASTVLFALMNDTGVRNGRDGKTLRLK